MPTLPGDRLAASYIYYDAQADDARLTLTVARTAADYGAAVANYATLVGLRQGRRRQVIGARVEADGDEFEIRARVVVNATGVWADDVRAIDEGKHPDTIRPAKGIHITVPWDLVRNQIAAVVPVPKDRRSVFVVPWGDEGTASSRSPTSAPPTPTTTDRSTIPQCTPDDIAYLLRAINASVTTTITENDVLGTWAGLRPLVRDGRQRTHRRPLARHSVRVSDSGVVTVTGGKLTTYRRMAADAVDEIMTLLDRKGRSRTKRVDAARRHRLGCDRTCRRHLAGRYGADARGVLALAVDRPDTRRADRPRSRVRARRGTARACATRWRRRSTTCSPGAPGPGSSPATRRPTRPPTSPR